MTARPRAWFRRRAEEASLAGWLGEGIAGLGPAKDQVLAWNEINENPNQANDYQADTEAGE
jgi:hypothetical protein